jgi:hypothetical protein
MPVIPGPAVRPEPGIQVGRLEVDRIPGSVLRTAPE